MHFEYYIHVTSKQFYSFQITGEELLWVHEDICNRSAQFSAPGFQLSVSSVVPQIDPSVPQPVVQSQRKTLLGPSPGWKQTGVDPKV